MKDTTVISYRHRQNAPIWLLLLTVSALFFGVAWFVRAPVWMPGLFAVVGFLMAVLGISFRYLRVEDAGDRIQIQFGPWPLFRTSILYQDILQIEIGKTILIEGWGIHLSPRDGWVWNLWGRDCVVVRHRKGTTRIGTDDVANLAQFLTSRLTKSPS